MLKLNDTVYVINVTTVGINTLQWNLSESCRWPFSELYNVTDWLLKESNKDLMKTYLVTAKWNAALIKMLGW